MSATFATVNGIVEKKVQTVLQALKRKASGIDCPEPTMKRSMRSCRRTVKEKKFERRPAVFVDEATEEELLAAKENKYTHICRNVYRCKPFETDDLITEHDECDTFENLGAECAGECKAGDRCTNNRIRKGLPTKLKVTRDEMKGAALYSDQRISKDDLVVEFRGVIMTNKQLEPILRSDKKHNRNMVFHFQLTKWYVLYPNKQGNVARHANHSCEPNCQMERIMVANRMCLVLKALRDIEKGEEITFDYGKLYGNGVDANGDAVHKQKCYCGSEKCREYI